jgi:hypothetical protein
MSWLVTPAHHGLITCTSSLFTFTFILLLNQNHHLDTCFLLVAGMFLLITIFLFSHLFCLRTNCHPSKQFSFFFLLFPFFSLRMHLFIYFSPSIIIRDASISGMSMEWQERWESHLTEC